jgi:uncharacterized lipoprotein
MKKITLLLFSLLILLSLAGCWPIAGENGLFHNRENAYLQSKNDPSLKIPADLSNQTNSTYVIPELKNNTTVTQPVSLAPPGSVLNPTK